MSANEFALCQPIELGLLRPNTNAFVFENGKPIDRVKILAFTEHGTESGIPEVRVISLDKNEGEVTLLAFKRNEKPSGWYVTLADGMTLPCFYRKNGHVYDIRHHFPAPALIAT